MGEDPAVPPFLRETLLFLPFFLNPIFLCFESQPNVSMSSPSFLARSVVCKNCC